MNDVVWDDFKVEFDWDALRQKCRVREGSKQEAILRELMEEATPIAKPKTAIRVLAPVLEGEKTVRLENCEIESPLLHKYLAGQSVVFPYVATCGLELYEWGKTKSGIHEFLAAEIMIQALRMASGQGEQRILDEYGFPSISAMNPGSLPMEWPIMGQRPLFDLMGDLPAKIGVTLLPSFLMTPPKSTSGLRFATAEKFHNCQICPNIECPERRVPYEPDSI